MVSYKSMGSVCAKNSVSALEDTLAQITCDESANNDGTPYPDVPFRKCEIQLLQKQWPCFMKDTDQNGIEVFNKYVTWSVVKCPITRF